MATVEQGPISSGLVNRVRNILLSPKTEWDRIDGEPATVSGLYTGYICILAAITPICTLIGQQVFGNPLFGRPGLISSVVMAITSYILALVGVFVFSLIVDVLAPSFGGQRSQVQALKVVAYSQTAGWVAGVLTLFPPLAAIAALIGLYGLYLLYLGLPKLMKAPQDKALVYTLVSVVVAVVIYMIIGAVSAAVMAMAGGYGALTAGIG